MPAAVDYGRSDARVNDRSVTQLAVGILSRLPAPSVEAFSSDGGVVALRVLSRQGGHIVAEAPRLRVRDRLDLLVRTTDATGGGYDISLRVVDVLEQADWMARVHLRVLDVQRRRSERVSARATLDEMAVVHVLGARALAQDEELDVRLADLSASGVAFVTDRRFHVGDRVAMQARIAGRSLRLQARVLQTCESHHGHQRVGCEIVQIADHDRRRIAAMTALAPDTGSPDQRLRPAS